MPARKPPNSVDELIRLAAWARERGYRIGPVVELGELKLQLQDLRQPGVETGRAPDDVVDDAYSAYGYDGSEPAPGTAG